ncbi:Type 12 methyltransferase [uncultured Pleomorphomonas sp.]|uniref:Type 12 methyltransferase n=2 Tax=uncultured Pleomorphomonas sp. TaxID=442121 RepID=A0A212L5S1_9HYPH|nr:Type 12 methyltransferase [uncultured Pleomorphomonas sp.]
MRKAAFDQNHASFRSLNQQMWQIPLISMTLTGGLWFGVSRAEDFFLFQIALLLLAAAGNGALFIILLRVRFVMEQYLKWLETNYPAGFVSARGTQWYSRSYLVRSLFQAMLVLAAVLSLILMGATAWTRWEEVSGIMPDDPALAYYESHARSLADGYETLSLESAHPALLTLITDTFGDRPLTVLDVGAGTGRDASWFASHGHRIVAVEPSPAMQEIGKRLHPDPKIEWRFDSLPGLSKIRSSGEKYDLIVLSAVWMHVKPDDRVQALRTLRSLLRPDGRIYLTLRIGPPEPVRGIYRVSVDALEDLLGPIGLKASKIDEQEDLLGRSNIKWIAMTIFNP